jgi:hypothetical protein
MSWINSNMIPLSLLVPPLWASLMLLTARSWPDMPEYERLIVRRFLMFDLQQVLISHSLHFQAPETSWCKGLKLLPGIYPPSGITTSSLYWWPVLITLRKPVTHLDTIHGCGITQAPGYAVFVENGPCQSWVFFALPAASMPCKQSTDLSGSSAPLE